MDKTKLDPKELVTKINGLLGIATPDQKNKIANLKSSE